VTSSVLKYLTTSILSIFALLGLVPEEVNKANSLCLSTAFFFNGIA